MSKLTLNIETTAHSLTNALKIIGKVIERRNSLPILSMVLFDGAKIRVTDLDIEIETTLPVIKAKGSAALDYGSLFNLVRNLPREETVRIVVEGGKATVVFSSGNYLIPMLPASDFPKLDIGETTAITIDGDELKKALHFVSTFMSHESTRYYLNGVCLDGQNVIATDGHRLSIFPVQTDFIAVNRMIVPSKVVSVMCGLPAPKGFVFSAKPGLRVQYDGLTITAKAIDGTFPNWARVVPSFTDKSPCVTFDRGAVRKTINRILSVTNDRGMRHGIFAFGNNNIVLKRSTDVLLATERLEAETASEMSIGLNFNYLTQILRSFPASRTLTMQVSDAGSPMKVMSATDSEYVVLMPARVDDKLSKTALNDAKSVGGEK